MKVTPRNKTKALFSLRETVESDGVLFSLLRSYAYEIPPEWTPSPHPPPLRMQMPPPFSSYPSKLIGITSRRTLVGL